MITRNQAIELGRAFDELLQACKEPHERISQIADLLMKTDHSIRETIEAERKREAEEPTTCKFCSNELAGLAKQARKSGLPFTEKDWTCKIHGKVTTRIDLRVFCPRCGGRIIGFGA